MRDRRLLMAILLIAGLIQAWIVHLYIVAAVMGGQAYWDHFVDLFGLDPVTVPGQICFDYCAPDLPFVAGWIGICRISGRLDHIGVRVVEVEALRPPFAVECAAQRNTPRNRSLAGLP